MDSGDFEKRETALLSEDKAFLGFAEKVAQKESQRQKRSNSSGNWIALYQHYITPALIAVTLGIGWAIWISHLDFMNFRLFQPFHWTTWAGIACLLMGTFCLTGRRDVIRWSVWLLMLLVGVGYGTFRLSLEEASPWQQVGHVNEAKLKGVVIGAHLRGKKTLWDVELTSLEDANGKQLIQAENNLFAPKIQASIPKQFSLSSPIGESVQLVGTLRPPFSTDIPGAFNEAAYLKGHDIQWVMSQVSEMRNLPQPSEPFHLSAIPFIKMVKNNTLGFLAEMRQTVSDGFQKALPSPFCEVLGGLVLGSHAIPLEKDLKQAFIDTGMIHILAASGMNVGIIAGVSLYCFKGLLFLLCIALKRLQAKTSQNIPFFHSLSFSREALAIVLTMICVLFYSGMTGLPPSILRAGGMIELALLLKLMNREAQPLTILALCVLLICLLDPFLLSNIGFQLSVLSTLGLVLMIPPLSRWLSPWIGPHFAGVLLVPIVAQMWVFPLTVYYFNQFPLHAIPLNIIAVYLITPLTILGFVSGGLVLLFEPLGVLIAKSAYPLLWALLWMIHTAHQWAWATWSIASFSPLSIGIGYTALAVVAWLWLSEKSSENSPPVKRQVARKLAIGLLMLSLWAGVTLWDRYQQFSHFQLTHLPLGRSRSVTVIQWPGASPRVSLIAPAQLTYWQENHLMGYLRHRGLWPYLGEILIHTPLQEDGEGEAFSSQDYKWIKRLAETAQKPLPVLIWGNPQTLSQEIVYGVAEGYWMAGLGEKQIWHSPKGESSAKGIWQEGGGLNLRHEQACLTIENNLTEEKRVSNPLSASSSCAIAIKLDSTGAASRLSVRTTGRSARNKFYALNHYLEAKLDGSTLMLSP